MAKCCAKSSTRSSSKSSRQRVQGSRGAEGRAAQNIREVHRLFSGEKPCFILQTLSLAPTHFGPMAKALTKSQIAASVAETVGITKKQAVQSLDTLAELAYKQAKNTFTVPGLGKLVLVNRPARTMTMQFGPKKGQTVKVPAKRVVKFRVAKAAKDAILKSK